MGCYSKGEKATIGKGRRVVSTRSRSKKWPRLIISLLYIKTSFVTFLKLTPSFFYSSIITSQLALYKTVLLLQKKYKKKVSCYNTKWRSSRFLYCCWVCLFSVKHNFLLLSTTKLVQMLSRPSGLQSEPQSAVNVEWLLLSSVSISTTASLMYVINIWSNMHECLYYTYCFMDRSKIMFGFDFFVGLWCIGHARGNSHHGEWERLIGKFSIGKRIRSYRSSQIRCGECVSRRSVLRWYYCRCCQRRFWIC